MPTEASRSPLAAVATFRFYAALNDFLVRAHRGRAFEARLAESASAKQAIEALGVPHTEVALLLVNGEAAGLQRPLRGGDRVAVYPKFEAFDIASLHAAPEPDRQAPRFIADAHLGGLARLLRMTGFDTVCDPALHDAGIEALAAAERRVVLTRDKALLMRRGVERGGYVRTLRPALQLREVFDRLDLARHAAPFSRCMECNAVLEAVGKAQIEAQLPPDVQMRQERFNRCPVCERVYWEGSHWQRMRGVVDALLATP